MFEERLLHRYIPWIKEYQKQFIDFHKVHELVLFSHKTKYPRRCNNKNNKLIRYVDLNSKISDTNSIARMKQKIASFSLCSFSQCEVIFWFLFTDIHLQKEKIGEKARGVGIRVWWLRKSSLHPQMSRFFNYN